MPKFESNPGTSLVFGKRERDVPKGPLECPLNCVQRPESFDHVTLRNTKSRPNGPYVSGFTGQSKINWLVDTGAVRNIRSYNCFVRLPEALSSLCMKMVPKCLLQMDAEPIRIYGGRNLIVRIGRKDITLRVLVADSSAMMHGIIAGCPGALAMNLTVCKKTS